MTAYPNDPVHPLEEQQKEEEVDEVLQTLGPWAVLEVEAVLHQAGLQVVLEVEVGH